MSKLINIGIVGYGNLGKGVEQAIKLNPDMKLIGIFTRRDVKSVNTSNNDILYHISEINKFNDKIDVMILCGGSATDLDTQGPMIAADFNTVDSFDTHARIPEYFDKMNEVAKKSGTCSVIATGWDPGLFSLNRLLGLSILPQGKDYTFWGNGVSQGHSDAIRQLEGVKYAVQYTVPKPEIIEEVRSGSNPNLTSRDMHQRICYVVPEDNADISKIEKEIKNMPNYFAGYETIVNFISAEEFDKEHRGMPHGGIVFRIGQTSSGTNQKMEFSIELDSNPEFTASVNVAYARAIYRLAQEGKTGAYTVFDIPFSYLSPLSPEELRRELL
ncbi:MAG: diaminopimelate dehydrogenase [Syntrophomonadaceae bacterium]|nr:diaminopimelate dehydrogenase [Syntrophomonadaceae bacterium]